MKIPSICALIIATLCLVTGCNRDEHKPKPTAAFSFSPATPKTGETVSFKNESKNADAYLWSSNPAGFSSSLANPTFKFDKAGSYEITLLARKGSKSATTKKTLVVVEATPAADFSFSPAAPKVGEKVQFTARDRSASDYEWSSNPAALSSKDKDPSYTFDKEGIYQVKLKITSAKGADSLHRQKELIASQSPSL